MTLQFFDAIFPMYFIANLDRTPMVSDTGERECLLAYTAKELAELYIEQAHEHFVGRLAILPILEHEYRDFLIAVRDDVSYINLNTPIQPEFFRLISVKEGLARLAESSDPDDPDDADT